MPHRIEEKHITYKFVIQDIIQEQPNGKDVSNCPIQHY
jgi:hypothetical protein